MKRRWFLAALWILSFASWSIAADSGDKLFSERVLPLLKAKCFACHGDDPTKLQGGLDLRSRAGMLAPADSGVPALVPGKPAQSRLYIAVTRQDPDLVMPPKERERLSAEQIGWLGQWIAAGAPWPSSAVKGTGWNEGGSVTVATSGGRTPDWTNRKYRPEDLWAYQPVGRRAVPGDIIDPAAVRNPIDAFLQHKLKTLGIKRLASTADARTLLRRATFDLTGLPPDSAEVDVFVRDAAADPQAALTAAIERLLRSDHYGVQQARHWLDVARYADSSGFSNDFERPHAWRYRDYVVRSFNADKPYDRFIVEQIAGDELDPGNPELAIAVGFLRMGPWEHTGMTVAALTRQQFLDDITHSVGVTFLAQGLRCCSCHDHKFDPVPTKDYYRMQAVFSATQFAERAVPFLPCENSGGRDGRSVIQARLTKAKAEHDALVRKSDAAIAAFLQERGLKRLTDLPEGERPLKDRYGLSDIEKSLKRIHKVRVDHFERELLHFEPYAFSVYNGPSNGYLSNKPLHPVPADRSGTVPVVHVLIGGSLDSPAEEVTAGVLSLLAGTSSPIPESIDGRRLALARWIASADNPLTARVIVNRVWQQHFGRGLVATPNNFGKMGKKPSHPELLDWLAAWFVENGWSLKKLHRLIMTSAAYQQSDAHPDIAELGQRDPSNELLAYFSARRLAAEEIRDALLAVSGELNRELGGPAVFPEIHWEVALQPRHTMGSVAPAYQPSRTPAERNRRTLYAFRCRTLADPLQEVFNRPGSETSCECRDATTVTPQVFALFNGSHVHDRALAFALFLEKHAPDLDSRIELAFRRCFGRAPGDRERTLCRAHVEKMTAYHDKHRPAPVPLPAQVRRKMIEEMTGEEYEWNEELDGMKNYVRDRQPWEAPAGTRALADLCLVLMNSNEFLYVR